MLEFGFFAATDNILQGYNTRKTKIRISQVWNFTTDLGISWIFGLDDDLTSNSRSSSSRRKSRFWSSSVVPWPCSLQYSRKLSIRTMIILGVTFWKVPGPNNYLYFSLVWPGRSRLEYCFERALKSFSPLPWPPLAGSKVGRAAVVMINQVEQNQST